MNFAVSADHKVKLKESEKKNKYLDLAREWKNLWNMNVAIIPIVICAHQRIIRGTSGLGNKRKIGDHPNYCIIDIGQNTEKSPGDLMRIAVTQSPIKDNQLTLKNSPGVNNNKLYFGIG